MFENITKFFKKITKKQNIASSSKDTAKERLHLVLMQDRANVSADFLDLMRQEIIDVIKKYIEVDESAIDVRLTNKENEDGTNGAPALYANIPIINIKEEAKKEEGKLAKEKKAEVVKKQNSLGDTSRNVSNEKNTIESENDKEKKGKHESAFGDGLKKQEDENSHEKVTNEEKVNDGKKIENKKNNISSEQKEIEEAQKEDKKEE